MAGYAGLHNTYLDKFYFGGMFFLKTLIFYIFLLGVGVVVL